MSENSNNNTNNNKPKNTEIGAIWQKISTKGVKYYTGNIEVTQEMLKNGNKILITLFENSWKEAGSNKPDWRIYLSNAPMNRTETSDKTAAKPSGQAPVKSIAPKTVIPTPKASNIPKPNPTPVVEEASTEGQPQEESTL